ncbi:unnamed protein product [Symbiodinium sp. CCMP2592]|nr:unnamed protein product [Symbiodinium sp. CCMP2592]
MFPSVIAMGSMSSLSALRTHYRVPQAVWDALESKLGDFADEIRNLAAIPANIFARSVESMTLADGSAPSVVQATQVGLVWRLARRCMWVESGRSIDDWVDPDPWESLASTTRQATATPSAAVVTDSERKVKMATILDQSDDSELVVGKNSSKDFLQALERYIATMGAPPTEESEPSLEQYLALKRRTSSGLPPYAEFSVFVPFARKALKASKFRSFVTVGEGEYMLKELPGPASITQWSACYKVYRTALIMLNVVSVARLQAYEEFVERMARRYTNCWHLVYTAEDRARAELSARVAHRITMRVAAGDSPPPGWTQSNPWDAVFKEILDSQDYWQEQLHQPALTWLAKGGRGIPSTPQEDYAAANIPGGLAAITPPPEVVGGADRGSSTRAIARKRKRAKDKEDLKKYRASATGFVQGGGKGSGKGTASGNQGSQKCYGWNNGNGASLKGLPSEEEVSVLVLMSLSGELRFIPVMVYAAGEKKRQAEADQGTILAARSVLIAEAVLNANNKSGIKPPVTLENPPPSAHPQHLSAWELPEVKTFADEGLLKGDLDWAAFPTCAFQPELEEGNKIFKPQRFLGSLRDLSSMSAACSCTCGNHKGVTITDSKDTAEYPPALCDKFANLIVEHLEKMATLEWLKLKENYLSKAIAELTMTPQGTKDPKSQKAKAKFDIQLKVDDMAPVSEQLAHSFQAVEGTKVRAPSAYKSSEAKPSAGNYGKVESPAKHVNEEKPHLGGMRNPALAVLGLPSARALGVRMIAAWESFVTRNPQALHLAERYGTKDATEDVHITKEWRSCLRKVTGSKGLDAVRLKDAHTFTSPLHADLFEAYCRSAGDPESEVHHWIADGTPLGMAREIKPCGIFPPAEAEEPQEELITAAEVLDGNPLRNYLSVVMNEGEADIELNRYEREGYLRRISVSEAKRRYGAGTISKLGLILKTKQDGSLKRRIVIDLKRSTGNKKAKLRERLTLPRPRDVIKMVKFQHKKKSSLKTKYKRHGWDTEDWAKEWVIIDVHDAFMHLAVHPDEIKHCMAPSPQEGEIILFLAVLLGFKTAPLVWARLAALTSRILQCALDPVEAAHQTYLDDALWALQGSLRRRNVILAFILYTLRALGFIVSLAKGARGREVTWCGVVFTHTQCDHILLGVSEKFLKDLASLLQGWSSGMAPIKELRRAAGKAAWLSGIFPRTRWATRMLYAALHSRLAEVASGTEERRRQARKDNRGKEAMFYVSRLNHVHLWLLKLANAVEAKPTRCVNIMPSDLGPQAVITTDASPMGLGAYLTVNGVVTKFLEARVTKQDAEYFGFRHGDSSSQGICEALAVLVAVWQWQHSLADSVTLTLRSDSVIALALTGKLSSPNDTLNLIGAELAFLLEQIDIQEFKAVHVPGAANKVADWLSRPHERSEQHRSAVLKHAKGAVVDLQQARSRGLLTFTLQTTRKLCVWQHLLGPLAESLGMWSGTAAASLQSCQWEAKLSKGETARAVFSKSDLASEEDSASSSASQEVARLATTEAAGALAVKSPSLTPETPRTGSSLKMLPVKGFLSAVPSFIAPPEKKVHDAGLGRLLTSVQEASRDNTFPPKPPAVQTWSQRLLQESRLGTGRKPFASEAQTEFEVPLLPSKRALKRRLSPLSPSDEADAVKALRTDYFAVTTTKPKSSRRRTVLRLASKVKKDGSVFPLQPRTLEVVAAHFKKAKYRSGASYLLELKLVHVERGHAWTHQLDRVMQLCKKSLSRRLGPRKKAKEVPLRVASAAGEPRTKKGKTACNRRPRATVASRVSKDLVEHAKAFHLAKGMKGPGPLCPASGGGKANKEATIKAWQALFGKETTGHSPRRSGALHYIREGHALQQVKHLGRWKSDVILEYAKEALASMPALGSSEGKPQIDVDKLVEKLILESNKLKDDIQFQLAAVKELVAKQTVQGGNHAPAQSCVFPSLKIRSHRSGIVHAVDPVFEGETPHLWKTGCGWPFGFSNYSFVTDNAILTGCKRCMQSAPGA